MREMIRMRRGGKDGVEEDNRLLPAYRESIQGTGQPLSRTSHMLYDSLGNR